MSCSEFYDYIEFLGSLDPKAPELLAAIECLKHQGSLLDKKKHLKARGLFEWEKISVAIEHLQCCLRCREHFHKTKNLDSCFCKILDRVQIPDGLIDCSRRNIHGMLQSEQSVGLSFEATIEQIFDHCLEDFRELLPSHFVSDIEGTIQEIFGNSVMPKEVLPDPAVISGDLLLIGVRKSWIFDNFALGVLFGYSDKKLILHVFDLEQADLFQWDGRLLIKEYGSLQHAVWMHAPLVFALVSDISAQEAKSVYTQFYQ
jgi:hypothetical protein